MVSDFIDFFIDRFMHVAQQKQPKSIVRQYLGFWLKYHPAESRGCGSQVFFFPLYLYQKNRTIPTTWRHGSAGRGACPDRDHIDTLSNEHIRTVLLTVILCHHLRRMPPDGENDITYITSASFSKRIRIHTYCKTPHDVFTTQSLRLRSSQQILHT